MLLVGGNCSKKWLPLGRSPIFPKRIDKEQAFYSVKTGPKTLFRVHVAQPQVRTLNLNGGSRGDGLG